MPIIETDAVIENGDELEIDLSEGMIKNLTKGVTSTFPPFPPFLQGIIDAGGLMNAMKKM